jgi:hypothetical protein
VLKRPKDKGTAFETWVVNRGKDRGLDIYRTPASSRYDIEVRGNTGRTIDALVTRPDYGHALATIRLDDLLHMLQEHGDGAHIECKRLAKVALHSIFEDKFSR